VDPRVSVVLPTKNRAALLRRSVASVLAQSYRDFELIVVDDGSTDDTPAVLQAIDDERLRVVRRESSSGVGAARNAGIAHARGELLAFQDDDDIWLCDKLARQVAYLETADASVGLVLCSYISLRRGRSRLIGGEDAFRRVGFSQGFRGCALIATPAWLVRKHLVDQLGGFDSGMQCWDDWELGLRLSDLCSFAHVDVPLYIQDWRRDVGAGTWDNLAKHENDIKIIIGRHGARWRDDPRVGAHHALFVARSAIMAGDGAAARRWLRKALRARPRSLKAWAYLVVSFLGPFAKTVHGLAHTLYLAASRAMIDHAGARPKQ
jgi:glycosyltransferase involved in cell wall biosynthesis